jgi:hypothetical protein
MNFCGRCVSYILLIVAQTTPVLGITLATKTQVFLQRLLVGDV